MNIEKIEIGHIYKNYKELCNTLDEEIKEGAKAKEYHLREIGRYIKLQKIEGTQKFKVEEIYAVPLEKTDLRIVGNQNKNSKYIIEIQDILTDYIFNNRDANGKVLLSFSKLINILGLVNNTYTVGNYRKKELSDILNIELKAVYYFYNNTRSEFKGIVERALTNLANRSVIHCNKKFMIAEKVKNPETKETYLTYREADSGEITMILDVQNIVLKSLEIKGMRELYLTNTSKYKEFVKLVKAELPKTWVYYFNVYELLSGEYAIKSEYELVKKRKQELNDKSKDRMVKCLKIVSDSDSEKLLVDKLIDLFNHDFALDEKIIDLYEQRKEDKNNKIKDNLIHIGELKKIENEIKQKQQDLIIDNEVVIQLFEDRDKVDKCDYYSYVKEKKGQQFYKELSSLNIFDESIDDAI